MTSSKTTYIIKNNDHITLSDVNEDKNIDTLIIRRSNIDSLNDLSYVFPNLKSLNIYSSKIPNALKSIDSTSLTSLIIRDHKLIELRETLSNQNTLEHLDISIGKIEDLRLPLVLPRLKSLIAESNHISKISLNETLIHAIERLSLKSNHITSLQYFPKNYVHLTSLDLSFNRLTKYDFLFASCLGLRYHHEIRKK